MHIELLPPRRLINLQAKLNAIFVKKRDTGINVDGLYRQLTMVERYMGKRRIFW